MLIDRRGTVWTPGLIDVTLRLSGRPVLAESPPPGVGPELARSLLAAAARLAGARGAAGAFTVSFLADPARGEHRLLGTAAGLPAARGGDRGAERARSPRPGAPPRARRHPRRRAAGLPRARRAGRPLGSRSGGRLRCPVPAWSRRCASPPDPACAPMPRSKRGRCRRRARRSRASPLTGGPAPRRSPASNSASPAPRSLYAAAPRTRPSSPRSSTAPS